MVKLIHTHKGTVYAQRNGVLIPVNTDGLVGYWPMTQGSGLTLYDESKTGNDGTLNNGPVWTDTANGKALDFDGVDDYVNIPSSSSLNVSSVTMSIWYKHLGACPGYNCWYLTKWDLNFKGMAIGFEGSNTEGIFVKDEARDSIFIASDLGNIRDGNWHHSAVSFDASTHELVVYMDGNQVASQTDASVDNIATGQSVRVGLDGSNNRMPNFVGDEVRIYNRALSAQEITNIYEKTRGLYGI